MLDICCHYFIAGGNQPLVMIIIVLALVQSLLKVSRCVFVTIVYVRINGTDSLNYIRHFPYSLFIGSNRKAGAKPSCLWGYTLPLFYHREPLTVTFVQST